MRSSMTQAILPTIGLLLFLAASTRLAAHGDLHERIEAVTQKILAQPSDPDLWLQRADLHRQHEEFDAALTDLEKAGQLKPHWLLVPLQLARIHFDQGNFSRAETTATDCLKLDQSNPDALVIRARSRVQLKKLKPAVADYDAVLNTANSAPPLPDLYLERARAQAALEMFDDAIHGLDDGLKRLGDTPSLALPAIEYERERRTFEAALERLERARKFLRPESFLATRGEILLQAGRPAEAKDTFEAGLASMENLSADRRAAPANAAIETRLRSGLQQARLPAIP